MKNKWSASAPRFLWHWGAILYHTSPHFVNPKSQKILHKLSIPKTRNFVHFVKTKSVVITKGQAYNKGTKEKGAKAMTEAIKRFFRIEEPFKLEYNDLRAGITLINVVLIMIFGLSISWFGLAVALIGVIKDLTKDRRINGLLMHLSNVMLNIYFLVLLYTGG